MVDSLRAHAWQRAKLTLGNERQIPGIRMITVAATGSSGPAYGPGGAGPDRDRLSVEPDVTQIGRRERAIQLGATDHRKRDGPVWRTR
jgi:hypothetical protein